MSGMFPCGSCRIVIGILAAIFFSPPFLYGYQILFYYNGADQPGSAVLKCADLLRENGNQVTVINVNGINRDPSRDNWGPPYDQVWDMRFVERDRPGCGYGSPVEADYFDKRWRTKAEDYLGRCGRLFIAGEHYQLADRDEGLYQFLKEIQAVKRGYNACPPSPSGNSSTDREAFYPVESGFGAVSFFGAYVGGIPLDLLNGKSFVSTKTGWQDYDGVVRSIVSAWEGDQLNGAVHSALCARGKLLMVWDASMWTVDELQTSEGKKGEKIPIWDQSSWFSLGGKKKERKSLDVKKAKKFTGQFFTAVSNWLGYYECPCLSRQAVAVSVKTAGQTNIPLALNLESASKLKPEHSEGTSSQTSTPSSISQSGKPLFKKPAGSPLAPQTIVFKAPPVNIYMRFKDGPGEYKLDILDSHGNHVRTLFDQVVKDSTESWASWNGLDEEGQLLREGNYTAVFTKSGIPLREITLEWLLPSR